MKITKTIDIAAPPGKVYSYLADFRRHSEWTTPGHDVHITAGAEGPAVVGASYVAEAHQMGSQRDELTVKELVPNQRIVYEAVMKDGNTFRHTFEITPNAGGSHLSKRFETLKLNLLSKLTLPLGMIVAPRMAAADTQRMKERLESS